MDILKIIYLKVKNPKYDGYQREITPIISNFFGKSLLDLQINLLPVVM